MRNYIPVLFLVAIAVTLLAPGCDELITDVTEITIAGNPTAEFGSDVDSGCTDLTVTFTDLSNGPRDSWLWQFGDGDSSTETTPTHIYDSAGTYTVTLTVSDDSTGGIDVEVKKRFIIVGTGVTGITTDIDSGCTSLDVTFGAVIGGWVSTWEWNFGDGTTTPPSDDSTPTHRYDSVGVFDVSVTVIGDCGLSTFADLARIAIVGCPVAGLFAADSSACMFDPIAFIDSSTVPAGQVILTKLWEFGDGTNSTSITNPTHAYDSSGTYTVKLTVTTDVGTSSTDSINVVVYDSTFADFVNVNDTAGCFSQFQQFQVKFLNKSLGAIDSVLWNFGDGNISNEIDPIHAYVTPGLYTVSLDVFGPCGVDDTIMTNFVILSDSVQGAFSITPTTGTVDSIFSFADLSTGVVLSRIWVFGDTASPDTLRLPNVTHVFANPGDYEISLSLHNTCDTIVVIDTLTVTP